MNVPIPYNIATFLSSCTTAGFSTRTQLLKISSLIFSVKFEVLTPSTIKITVFWDLMLIDFSFTGCSVDSSDCMTPLAILRYV